MKLNWMMFCDVFILYCLQGKNDVSMMMSELFGDDIVK